MPGELGGAEKSRKGVRSGRGFHDEEPEGEIQRGVPEGDSFLVFMSSVNQVSLSLERRQYRLLFSMQED